MPVDEIRLDIEALALFETLSEARVVRVVLKFAHPDRKLSAALIAELAGLGRTAAQRGIDAALANGTLVAVILPGKERVRTYEIGPKLAPFVWPHFVAETNAAPDNVRPQSVAENEEADSGITTECGHSLSDAPLRIATECGQSEKIATLRGNNGHGTVIALKQGTKDSDSLDSSSARAREAGREAEHDERHSLALAIAEVCFSLTDLALVPPAEGGKVSFAVEACGPLGITPDEIRRVPATWTLPQSPHPSQIVAAVLRARASKRTTEAKAAGERYYLPTWRTQ